MVGTQHPTLTRLKETNTSLSIEIRPSPTIHSGAGPPLASTAWFAFERSSTSAQDLGTCRLTMNLSICTHTFLTRSSILSFPKGVFICVDEGEWGENYVQRVPLLFRPWDYRLRSQATLGASQLVGGLDERMITDLYSQSHRTRPWVQLGKVIAPFEAI